MKNKRKNASKKGRTRILLGLATTIIVVVLVGGFWLLKDVPSPAKLETGEYPESSRIYDRNGILLYEFFGEKRRVAVGIDQIPENLIEATIAIEDAKFYKHFGFDFRGIMRAAYRTLFRKKLEGGSTLTQQLVKNALLTPERTVVRKVKEAFLALATEAMYSKEEILEMYLNQTPYGGTYWGVESAARGYFNKDVKDLSLAESALIAGLPGSPTSYSPFAHPDAAKNRQLLVLRRMKEEGFISEEEENRAAEEELNYYVDKEGIRAPHFVFYVREMLLEKYGIKRVNEGGLDITTTLDLALQQEAERIVREEIESLERYKISNGAVVVTQPKTGQILAMVGSKDYFAEDIDGKFNVTTALRQPGSSIKPLVYAVAMENSKVTAASVINDNPACFKVPGQKDYCPTNYGYSYFGIQSVRNSLANSLNIPAVKVIEMVGVENFVASASAMGLKTFEDASNYGLSLTLGGGEVKMVDMAEAFGVLANGGIKQELTSILEIKDRQGEVLESFGLVPGERKLSRETSFLVADILSDDGARSMVFGRGSKLNIKDHPEVAVKTGTTNDLRDNWTIGYTPDFVTVVWVGNNDNSKMSWVASGVTGATPIWHDLMSHLLEDQPAKKWVMPNEMKSIMVCNLTGKRVPEQGCESHFEYFAPNNLPGMSEVVRRPVLIDKETGKIISAEEGEGRDNVEWQERDVVIEATGEWVCLDCPKKDKENKEEKKE